MIILGIDPGTTVIGYGLVETGAKGLFCLDYGVFRVQAGTESNNRITSVYDFFEKLIKKYQPDKAGIEKLFFFKNAKTITRVSETKGVILLALQKLGVEVSEFTPLQIKQAVSNYGRADKKQVQKIISLILGLKEIPQPDDAADALATAICCANTTKWNS
ncbi:MAG: crossover junction endodeoxyribonuclease RuvC [Candidatus Yanofskybacteria bacterium]|nr:crossover junction endodeoxyribonuclease RuvC [Candidatus Yanofskybacteria bacterium]